MKPLYNRLLFYVIWGIPVSYITAYYQIKYPNFPSVLICVFLSVVFSFVVNAFFPDKKENV